MPGLKKKKPPEPKQDESLDIVLSDDEILEAQNDDDAPKLSLEEQLTDYINQNVVGKTTTFRGPFGRKQVIYCDHGSTGRALRFLEAFMVQEVLPAFSDATSTMSTVTALQTALYLDETRFEQH